jgi:hypothetical protein
MQHSDKPRHPSDPRKELVSDHRYWEDVLYNAWHLEEKNLYGLLHGLRCGGAELTLTKHGYRLMPGKWNESEWEEIKQNRLSHFRHELVFVFQLTRLGKVTDEEPPFEDKPAVQGRMFG